MAGQTGKSGVICPFFKKSEGLIIGCEPPIDMANMVQLCFKKRRGYDFHYYQYCCNRHYKYCEIYRMVYAAKYEEE